MSALVYKLLKLPIIVLLLNELWITGTVREGYYGENCLAFCRILSITVGVRGTISGLLSDVFGDRFFKYFVKLSSPF